MLTNNLFLFIIATVLGAMSALGIGGGSLLMVWLSVVVGLDTNLASTVNLLFFLVAAGTVSLLRWKKGALNIKKILPGILSGCLAAAIIGIFRHKIPHELMEKLLGAFLMIVGLRELFYRDKKAK